MSSLNSTEVLTVAVASDDGRSYIDRHFGDAAGIACMLFPNQVSSSWGGF